MKYALMFLFFFVLNFIFGTLWDVLLMGRDPFTEHAVFVNILCGLAGGVIGLLLMGRDLD